MNSKVVQDLVSFAIAEAARQDCAVALGPIHLMKYLYLADWAYAKTHEGATLTEIPWKFYHFGPYSGAVEEDLEKAANITTGGPQIFLGSKSGKEVKRWEMEQNESTDSIYLELERRLPCEAVSTIKWSVKEFGSSTYPLLHYVYATLPMRLAAPGELLDFSAAIQEQALPANVRLDPLPVAIAPPGPALSTTQKKKKEKAFEALKERMEAARARSEKSWELLSIESPEDEIYLEGISWLDSLAVKSQPFMGTFEIDPSVWHSSLRRSIQ